MGVGSEQRRLRHAKSSTACKRVSVVLVNVCPGNVTADIAEIADVKLNDRSYLLTLYLKEHCREQDQADHGWSRCVVPH